MEEKTKTEEYKSMKGIPNSIKLLAVLYSIFGLFWIWIGYFYIYKVKKLGLYFAVGMSVFDVAVCLYAFAINLIDIRIILLLILPVTTAYVMKNHRKEFK